MSEKYTELYAKREKIQLLLVSGPFQSLRDITILITLSFYFIVPWTTWNGRQAILFDLPGRKFYVFGFTFWPQDFILLTGILIIAALSLFLVTVIAGRIWCGYTCPQTVWTKLFLLIERAVEGNRSQRIKLDKMHMTPHKFMLRLTKHTLWLLLALATAITFVGFFSPIKRLVVELFSFNLHFWEFFWLGFFTMATYINAGWMREQVCLYMCPYARFQSVMFDQDSLIISYDYHRGDPRGPRSRKADRDEVPLGDCINCYQCVHACPTGIDIRDGLQIECIGCAACIDACNNIMDKMGYPRGLVTYTTQNKIDSGLKPNVFRVRTLAYTAVLFLLISLFTFELLTRPLVQMDIIRDRNQLYRINNDGDIENVYQIKVMNKSQQTETYTLSVSEPDVYQLHGSKKLTLPAGDIETLTIRLSAKSEDIFERTATVDMFVTPEHDQAPYKKETRFLAP